MKWNLLAVVLMAVILTVGCGGDAEQADTPGDTGGSATAPPAAEKPEADNLFPAEQATAAITGKILFEGDPPPPQYVSVEAIAAAKDEFCELHHKDAPVLIEDLIVSSDGAIRNVLVYVKKFPEDWTHAIPADPVVIDQKNCTYIPHVSGVMVGQTVQVTSSDDTAHNVNLVARRNRGFSVAVAMGDIKDVTFKTREDLGAVYFKCDIHSWMKSWVGVFKHPFHAVTGDDGSFDLGKLPPGEYTIGAWHETLGDQELQVTLQEGGAGAVDFTFQKEE